MLCTNGFRTYSPVQQLMSCLKRLSTAAEGSAPHTSRTSVDSANVAHLGKHSNEWWDESGIMKPLHSMNSLRVPFIRDGLFQYGSTDKSKQNTPKPLEGVSIIDVGCGGGVLSEPLARIGASVLGIDASAALISVAQKHAELDKNLKNLHYLNVTAEALAQEKQEQFDAVVSSEVIEHILDKNFFLEQCISLLKPQGSIFISTLNRTTLSWLGAIIAAENVLGIVPQGTHDWNQFMTPHELQIMLERNGCLTRVIHGMFYNPITNEWSWSKSTAVNYILHAVKVSS